MAAGLHELRYASRVLWRQRTATLVSIVTLTLAIGATTGIFTVVDATLLRALPFPAPDRLVQICRKYNGPVTSVSTPKFIYWRDHGGDAFASVAAYDTLGAGFNLVASGRPDRVGGSRVSAGFFAAMGVPPLLGRDFRPEEDLPGQGKVVVVSYDLWQQRFEGRPDLIGQAITINGEPHTVIGIMPDGFSFPDKARLWTLFQFDPAAMTRENYFEVVGRMKPGLTLAQARETMNRAGDAFRTLYPDLMDKRETIYVAPLRERLYGSLRTALLVLLAAVGFVLLIACVNVANLQLAQASSRTAEIALRAALGASTWSIVRPLLIESMLLATISGILGICLAYASVPALLALSPLDLAQASTIRVDVWVLLFAMGMSLLCGILFGLLPAWQASRPDLDQVLRAGARRTTSGSRGRLRRALIAVEVALALMLTVGSFLLVKSLAKLRAIDPGFAIEHVVTMKLVLPEARYGTGETLAQFQERIEERLTSLPGVHGAVLAQTLPLEDGFDLPFTIEGQYVPGTEKGVGDAFYRASGPGFFQTLQIPIRQGRLFDARDRRGALPVAIINESAAKQFWKGQNPIGQHIHVGQPFVKNLADPTPREIIGVVANVYERSLSTGTPAIVYVPLAQQNDGLTLSGVRLLPFSIALRGEGSPASLAQAAQQAVAAIDPNQPISDVRLMREIVSHSLGSETFNAALLGSLALLALLLAAVGLYGVISHLVGQQTREIGIRMALGATQANVLRLFVQQALLLAGIGVVIGLFGARVLTRFLQSLLSDISTTDPWVFAAAPILLLAVALIAAFTPALRASRVDPSSALRAE